MFGVPSSYTLSRTLSQQRPAVRPLATFQFADELRFVAQALCRDTYENMNYVNHCLTWFSVIRPCFSQQVFYGSRRLADRASHCQRSEASRTM